MRLLRLDRKGDLAHIEQDQAVSVPPRVLRPIRRGREALAQPLMKSGYGEYLLRIIRDQTNV